MSDDWIVGNPAIFSICGGIVQSVMGSVGGMALASVTMYQEI